MVLKKLTFVMLFITFIMYISLTLSNYIDGTNAKNTKSEERGAYLNIMTTNKPLCEMVKSIVGDKHNVEYLFEEEEEVKTYEFDKRISPNLNNMDILFYIGNNFEPWISDAINDINSETAIINISRGIGTIYLDENNANPYFWTGLNEYKIALYNIKSTLQDKDPKNRKIYDNNYNAVIEELNSFVDRFNNEKKNLNQIKIYSTSTKYAYFLNSLNTEVTYLNVNEEDRSITDMIQEDGGSEDKQVVVIMDQNDKYDLGTYKGIRLKSYSSDKSFTRLLKDNYKTFYNSLNLENEDETTSE